MMMDVSKDKEEFDSVMQLNLLNEYDDLAMSKIFKFEMNEKYMDFQTNSVAAGAETITN